VQKFNHIITSICVTPPNHLVGYVIEQTLRLQRSTKVKRCDSSKQRIRTWNSVRKSAIREWPLPKLLRSYMVRSSNGVYIGTYPEQGLFKRPLLYTPAKRW